MQNVSGDSNSPYRAFVVYCVRMSHESHTPDQRMMWLGLAADWLSLITETSFAHSEQESFWVKRAATDTPRAEAGESQQQWSQPERNLGAERAFAPSHVPQPMVQGIKRMGRG